jgi:hypothetical protein
MPAKTIVIISDLHAGSVFGLTPPEHYEADDARRSMQKEAWNAYHKIVKKWHKPDFLCVNGDAIDGSQSKMSGAELTTPDRNIQSEMAEECITMWDAGKILMTYGSAYHVSAGAEDFEYNIAHKVKAEIGGRLNFEIEGVEFDMRHKVGSSGIPHGRGTPLLREMMWNLMKDALDGTYNPDRAKMQVVVRSHVHYHMWIEQPGRLMFTTPALQLSRGRYGSRECTGETHWGAIRLTVKDGQIINKEVEICALEANRPKLMKLK